MIDGKEESSLPAQPAKLKPNFLFLNKSLLGRTQVVVDGKIFVGKKVGKPWNKSRVLIAENYEPNFVAKSIGTGLLGLSILIGAGIHSGCNKERVESPVGPSPVAVTLKFDVYNHMQGCITGFEMNTMSETPIDIKVSSLGISGVDSQRIVIRENVGGGSVGTYVAFSNKGTASFKAPKYNANYGIFLMNKSNGTDYQLIIRTDILSD